jgi:hypothetical protein
MGIDRRYKRMIERDRTKYINKVKQDTLDKINKNPPKEREELLMLYKHMLEQAELNKQKREQELLANQTNIDDV